MTACWGSKFSFAVSDLPIGKKEDNGLKFAFIFKDNMKDKLHLKNVSLKVQRKKLLLQLRQVRGFVFLSFFLFLRLL